MLAQFLKLLPRYEFKRLVDKYNGDYRTRSFKCWDQLASMMIAHINKADSLRDLDISLNAHAKKLYHLGISQAPRSTLAEANEKRDHRIYEEFAMLCSRPRRFLVRKPPYKPSLPQTASTGSFYRKRWNCK